MLYRIGGEAERQQVIHILSALDLKRPYSCNLKQIRKRRGLQANKVYWMWITCLCFNLTGHKEAEYIDEFHRAFKKKYLPVKIVEILGNRAEIPCSTKTLDSKQFFHYMENVRMEAAEVGVDLPMPEEPGYNEMLVFYENLMER